VRWRPGGGGGRGGAGPPARLGGLTSFGAAPRSPPWPSGPSGALHTSGVRCADDARRVASKPGQAPPPPINFALNSPAACSNIEFASFELQRFWGVSKNDHDKLRAKFGMRWCRCCPWAPQLLRTPNVVWLVVLGFWGVPLCVVTNVVNPRCFSCGFLGCCYKRRQFNGFFVENTDFSA